MHSLGNGGLPWRFPGWNRPSRRRRCKGSDDVTGEGVGSKPSSPFPVKQAAAAASLIVAGDTIAQVSERLKTGSDSPTSKVVHESLTLSRLIFPELGNLLSGSRCRHFL